MECLSPGRHLFSWIAGRPDPQPTSSYGSDCMNYNDVIRDPGASWSRHASAPDTGRPDDMTRADVRVRGHGRAKVPAIPRRQSVSASVSPRRAASARAPSDRGPPPSGPRPPTGRRRPRQWGGRQRADQPSATSASFLVRARPARARRQASHRLRNPSSRAHRTPRHRAGARMRAAGTPDSSRPSSARASSARATAGGRERLRLTPSCEELPGLVAGGRGACWPHHCLVAGDSGPRPLSALGAHGFVLIRPAHTLLTTGRHAKARGDTRRDRLTRERCASFLAALALGSGARKGVGVRLPPPAPPLTCRSLLPTGAQDGLARRHPPAPVPGRVGRSRGGAARSPVPPVCRVGIPQPTLELPWAA
jgi:hypothetical protein